MICSFFYKSELEIKTFLFSVLNFPQKETFNFYVNCSKLIFQKVTKNY